MQESIQKELLLLQWLLQISFIAFRKDSLTLNSEIPLHIKLSYLVLAAETALVLCAPLAFLKGFEPNSPLI